MKVGLEKVNDKAKAQVADEVKLKQPATGRIALAIPGQKNS
jgi:hypothetical protein